jgi:transposase
MSTIASYHQVKKEKLYRSYKENMRNFKTWEQRAHAMDYLLYPQNIADKLAIDEVSFQKVNCTLLLPRKDRMEIRKN